MCTISRSGLCLMWRTPYQPKPSDVAALRSVGGVNQFHSTHGDPPSCCVGPLFLHGGRLWYQHIKDPHGNNLQFGVQTLCHSGVPQSSLSAQTVVWSSLHQAGTAIIAPAIPSPCLEAAEATRKFVYRKSASNFRPFNSFYFFPEGWVYRLAGVCKPPTPQMNPLPPGMLSARLFQMPSCFCGWCHPLDRAQYADVSFWAVHKLRLV